ncbi:hypothetical protein KKG22_00905 [Patescibacteria group bacterium]|nr:hypothetical protein [Patescibacteria group bacterium]MBU1721994.1 hypothetical protein [Patescibacteria group bacterium]MBU1901256.1 hypothetical protein [Patescibacteria group bacterium]
MKYVFGSIIALVVLIVGVGLYQAGSPSKARDFAFDQDRVNDLRNIVYTIQNYVDENKSLPQVLDELSYIDKTDLTDNQTGKAYEYQVTGDKAYTLCATFMYVAEDDENYRNNYLYAPPSYRGGEPTVFHIEKHGAGTQCFNFKLKEIKDGEAVYYQTATVLE